MNNFYKNTLCYHSSTYKQAQAGETV